MCPVSAPIVPMAGALGASRPIMSPRFPSQVGLQVVGPRKIYHAGIGIFTSHNFGDD